MADRPLAFWVSCISLIGDTNRANLTLDSFQVEEIPC